MVTTSIGALRRRFEQEYIALGGFRRRVNVSPCWSEKGGCVARAGGDAARGRAALGRRRYRDLPELVAAYIEAFAAMWPDIAGTQAKP
jgi:hypothetical protein